MCDNVLKYLPQELMNMVYSHIDDFEEPILVDYKQRPSVFRHARRRFVNRNWSHEVSNMPWFLDTKIVTLDFAIGMLKNLYSNKFFTFERPYIIKHFLDKNLSNHIHGIVRRDHVRHLNIEIPYLDYGTKPSSSAQLDILMGELDCLREFKPVKVYITFKLASKRLYDEDIGRYTNFEKHSPILMTGRLLPVMTELRAKDHVITIKEYDTIWVWTPTTGEISWKTAQDDLEKHMKMCFPDWVGAVMEED
ncbi:hypothetical protein PtrSN002B_009899 [Pyrenophora tritici-repentis]|nr:hypothetical protein A1F99_104660 [Pyrenophora tritici-repentis]KAF7565761.1 hypothetical protein PtrM4_051950 [Pyrenophora tritici-repentis]KAI0574142.1 hypothetical protein Alg215_08770 [Pyrenophora tritici-repentis]KAI0581114.1 hypothetical protein Alg130_06746 [Pyrenophora tritici-repentis]KAI0608446.1 hypothetical protein TUN205_07301 [Pyrenophora tritici-repentis]